MSVLTRRPVLRWAVPGAALLIALGSGVAVNALHASADATLPPRTPAQLLADIHSAQLDAGSGTVVETADLGLPQLPNGAGGSGSSDLSSMLTGSHTLRVWYSGPDKARAALLGSLGESDVIVTGTDMWVWSSSENKAQHTTFTGGPRTPMVDPSRPPTTPQQAADQILAALDPTTAVSTDDTVVVAGRPAYDLVLRPKDAGTLVGSVNIAIDGQRHVPLRVQVYPRSGGSPAFEIGFKQVSFARPDDAVFAFTPPAGVTVTENKPDAGGVPSQPKSAVIGTGWTSVLALRTGALGGSAGGDARKPGIAGSVLSGLPSVSGAWGSGRLLSGTLFSALITDDGRVLVGAVSPQRLLAAAADPAAALK